MLRSDFEIMAPVGSEASLHAALRAGADAVYFGVAQLNMRARSSSANFGLDDLRRIATLCRRMRRKAYLTVNTTVYDTEMGQMEAIVDAAARAGVSAVIASDPAVIDACADAGVPVHISTQCNVSNVRALRHYARWADTVVLARELSLDQVAAIHRAIHDPAAPILGPSGRPVQIEMFCHGALCMAVSGKCYMSLHQMNSSANRGACTQICRRAYTVTDANTGDQLDITDPYVMSPRDLKTVHFLDRMVMAGVTVFKIEGRARGPEYVRATVQTYDQALRAVCDGSYGRDPEQLRLWDQRLATVFNRGFWDGYYLGQRLGEWTPQYGSAATRTKRYAARCLRYYPRLGVGEFRMEAGELSPGDTALVIGDTTGAVETPVTEIRVGDDPSPAARAVRGDVFSIRVPSRVRPGDSLYRWE